MLVSCRNLFRFCASSAATTAPRGLYLDYQATTPIDYRVLDAMLPFMTQSFGNPHSKTQYILRNAANTAGRPKKQLRRRGSKCRSSLSVTPNSLYSHQAPRNPTISL